MDGQPQSIEPAITEENRKKQKPQLFKKGQTGNPNGRPKKQPKSPVEIILEDECRKYTQEALQVWLDAIRGEDVPWNSKLKAAENIVDRGYGKAKETIEHKMTVSDVFADVVREVNEQRRARLQGPSVELVAESIEVCEGGSGGEA